jgi:hypothetical protein
MFQLYQMLSHTYPSAAVKPTVLVLHTEGELEGSRKRRPRLSHGHVGAGEKTAEPIHPSGPITSANAKNNTSANAKKHTAVKPTVLVRHTEGEREGSRKQRPRLSHGHVGAEEKKRPSQFIQVARLLPRTRKTILTSANAKTTMHPTVALSRRT